MGDSECWYGSHMTCGDKSMSHLKMWIVISFGDALKYVIDLLIHVLPPSSQSEDFLQLAPSLPAPELFQRFLQHTTIQLSQLDHT